MSAVSDIHGQLVLAVGCGPKGQELGNRPTIPRSAQPIWDNCSLARPCRTQGKPFQTAQHMQSHGMAIPQPAHPKRYGTAILNLPIPNLF